MTDLFAVNRLGNTIADKVDASGDCWIWTASLTTGGYGQVWWQGKMRRAHRFVYEALVSPIPEGLELDHLCRVRACVNPDHLEPVSPAENVQRSYVVKAVAARNRAKRAVMQRAQTHCQRGHPFSGENLYTAPDGYRACRTCRRAANRRCEARRRRAA